MSESKVKALKCDFKVLNEAQSDWISATGWHLLLQWGIYKYSDKTEGFGYRFIYRRPDGKLQSRGQARIPSLRDAQALMDRAHTEGWGDHRDLQELARKLEES